MGLIQAMVAISIMATAGLISAKQSVINLKTAERLEERSDLEIIKRSINDGLDKQQTLALAGITAANRSVVCNTTSATDGQIGGTFIRLVRKTKSGNIQYFTDALYTTGSKAGSARMGKWSIRVTCSDVEDSFVIRAARISKQGLFLKDPLNSGITQDFYHHKKSLLSGIGNFPISLFTESARPSLAVLTTGEAARKSGTQDTNSVAPGITIQTIDLTQYPEAGFVNFSFKCKTSFAGNMAQGGAVATTAKANIAFVDQNSNELFSVDGCKAGSSNNLSEAEDTNLIPVPEGSVAVVLRAHTEIGSSTPLNMVAQVSASVLNQ